LQCLVLDTGVQRIAVDTCVGNDKDQIPEAVPSRRAGPRKGKLRKADRVTDRLPDAKYI